MTPGGCQTSFSRHVHNYQRIEKTIAPDGPTPFIVTGNGGYHDLRAVHSAVGDKAPDSGAALTYFTCKRRGFTTFTIDKESITGSTTEVDRDGKVYDGDLFKYIAKPIALHTLKDVPTL